MRNVSDMIISLENAALEKWNAGDPDGYPEPYASDISYFDPAPEQRIDGLRKMIDYYEMARGKSTVIGCAMIDPSMQVTGTNPAVLSYDLHQVTPGKSCLWHCTRSAGGNMTESGSNRRLL